ncbi:MAG: HAMP domain-containing protein, partial [Spirochaetales bacterium]|nr:HAMP domain-containing protein [Spirochaetales bacterium]
MKIRFSSYKLKISLLIIIMTSVVSATTALISITSIRKSAVEIQAEQSLVLLAQAMKLIDLNKLKYLIETDDAEDPYYIETCTEMNRLRHQTNAKYLYLMTQIKGTLFKYVLDGNDFDDEENYSPIGTEEDIASYGKWPFICLKEQRTVIGDVSDQEGWGWASTVYMPIIDENQKSIAFIACDYNFEKVMQIIRTKTMQIIFTSLSTIFICIIILLLFVSRVFSRINAVANSMNSIASGKSDLTTKLPVKSDSEVDNLAKACNGVTDYLQNIIKNIKDSMYTLSDNNTKMTKQNQNILKSVETMLNVNHKISNKSLTQSDLTVDAKNGIKTMLDRAHLLDENVENQSTEMSKSSSAVEEISANIHTADQLIQKISDEYSEIVDKTIQEQRKMQKITDEIHRIVEQAQNLNDANNMITEIAQRTNLLAM